jgi:tetratricopeptide (TPR) repeat protein
LKKLRDLPCPNWLEDALVSLLENQKKKLSALCRQDPPILQAKAIDLYHGARLKQAIGEYTDAIWRAASAYEQVLIERALEALKKELGYRPDPYRFKESLGQIYDLNDPQRQQRQREIMRKLAGISPTSNLSAQALLKMMEPFLGVDPAGKILRITDQQFEMKFFLNVLQDLLRVRNNAVHRASPVSKEEVERGLELVREAMRKQFGDSIVQEIENYALSKESLEQIADAMERLL